MHPAHELLIHILDPNRSVEGNYRAYTVTTDEGRVVTGLLAAESKTTLQREDGYLHTQKIIPQRQGLATAKAKETGAESTRLRREAARKDAEALAQVIAFHRRLCKLLRGRNLQGDSDLLDGAKLPHEVGVAVLRVEFLHEPRPNIEPERHPAHRGYGGSRDGSDERTRGHAPS